MPRTVEPALRAKAINMMNEGDSQYEIHRELGVSRPYIRKTASQVGHQFPRNGIEIKPPIISCLNCDLFFRRPLSKIASASRHFCSDECRVAYQAGENHPSWRGGSTAKSFSTWVQGQSEYKDWRNRALERSGNACQITGSKVNIDVHHVYPKADNPEKAFDDDNALVLAEPAHIRIHQLLHQSVGFLNAIDQIKQEYQDKKLEWTKNL